MTECLCFDETYSTTRVLTQERPVVKNNPEDTFETVLFLPENKERKGEGGLRTEGYFKKSYEGKPLLSVVTVVYNGEKYLEQTIQSVINQSYDNVEYIIIDGGSTDGTLDIIKKYEHAIDYWVSEPDKGIYDAMNKGIMLCMGEMIGLINADDYYLDNIFKEISERMIKTKKEMIYGDMIYRRGEDTDLVPAHHTGLRYRFSPYSKYWVWINMIFAHPSVWIRCEAYKRWGLYDTNYKISGDYDLMLRFIKENASLDYIKRPIAVFREGGISTSDIGLVRKENYLARKTHNRIIAVFVEIFLSFKSWLR